MSALMIEVHSRVVGGGREVPLLVEVFEELTVAELVRRAVEEQIREFLVRRKMDVEEARLTLDRHYLTDEQLAGQARSGAVRLPSPRTRSSAIIEPAAEVERALRAFATGVYLILVDGRQVTGLDEVVRCAPSTKVTFLRLMPLRGG